MTVLLCVRCSREFVSPPMWPGLKLCHGCWKSQIPDYWINPAVCLSREVVYDTY